MRWTWSAEKIVVILLVLGAIGLRFWHLPESLNFSTDQATFATRAWEIWQNKEFTLAGPTASFSYQGRYLIQSSAIFYQTLVFLLPVDFDPIAAGFLVAIWASLMIVPLYLGAKLLTSKAAAMILASIYAFLPVYVNYTRFLWNPNYQLLYTPLLIFALGKYRATHSRHWLLTSGLAAGFLMLFHYQFGLAILGLTLILVYLKTPLQKLVWWFGGLGLGLSPILAFELNSRFYLTQTLWLLLNHRDQAVITETATWPTHYFLSLSLLVLTGGLALLLKHRPQLLSPKVAVGTTLVCAGIGVGSFFNTPDTAFGMAPGWNFLLEDKAHNIIVAQELDNYAVVNTLYETTASVQYYLLKTHQDTGWTIDYQNQTYLFVIAPANQTSLTDNSAYELSTFVPSDIVKHWELSSNYWLYLLTRDAS